MHQGCTQPHICNWHPTQSLAIHVLRLWVGIMRLHLQELLAAAPADCELHYVGKRGGQPSIKQQAINRLLVQLCQQVRGALPTYWVAL